MEQKTPLYQKHLDLGGKMVPFAGYLLPVQYESIIAEHMAVRTAAGLFDVSHMGEVFYKGPDALANLNYVCTNDFTKMEEGRVRYSVMCNEQGGTIDDLILYKLGREEYMTVPNAANKDKDVAHMRKHLFGNVTLTDCSKQYAQLALQGPKSAAILKKVTDDGDIPPKYYTFNPSATVGGIPCILSQTGYTGEHGFELYIAPEYAASLWDLLLEAGREHALIPCGLGARDTLRLEAGMPLYGHEMNDSVSPLETGLGFCVKLEKEAFIGKEGLVARGDPKIARVGLRVLGRGIVREGNSLYVGEKQVGLSTSGTHCPYLGYPAAMGLVEKEYQAIGTVLEAEVRGRRVSVEVVPLPFYKRTS